MAHEITLPLSFEFRKRHIEWECLPAHVTGWADGPERPRKLIAQIGVGTGTRTVNLLVSDFTDSERRRLLASLKRDSVEDQRKATSELKLNVFAPSKQIALVDRELKKHSEPADAWLMRDDFLRMGCSSSEALAFLREWGRWRQMPAFVETREMFALQQQVRDALVVSPESWFATANAFMPKMSAVSKQFPYFAAVTDACREAICVATTVDLLKRVEFKVCARGDCGKPFEVVSKHSKQYCTQYCAHIESVRRNRKSKAATRKAASR